MNNERVLFREKTQNIVQWRSPQDDTLFETTFLNRGKILTRWDQIIYVGNYPPINKFEEYWCRLMNNETFKKSVADPILCKYKYHWMIQRLIPNDIQLEFFREIDKEWEYFSNREDKIPLRWSNIPGNYYTPLIKRRNINNNKTQSLCPYCHFDSPENAVFFNDELFLSYQYHLWDEHFVSNKGSSEASPFVFHKVENNVQISCQKCHYKYQNGRLDLDEYIDHVSNCRIKHSYLEIIYKANSNIVRFSECDKLILYDQTSFNLNDDTIFDDQHHLILGDLRARKLEEIEYKKQLIREKYKRIRK